MNDFRLARSASLASTDVIYGRASAGEGVLGIRIDARLWVNDLRSEGKARPKSYSIAMGDPGMIEGRAAFAAVMNVSTEKR